jgi:hypothetical protein
MDTALLIIDLKSGLRSGADEDFESRRVIGTADLTLIEFSFRQFQPERNIHMSFQAYLDNIRAKTGKTPEQFKALAARAGVYRPDMKAGALVAWLKEEFDLGHGHAMAVWAVFKDRGWVDSAKGRN